MLVDLMDDSNVSVKNVLQSIKLIFDISETELTSIFDEWAEANKIELNNKLANIRNNLLAKTGIELELTFADINKLLKEDTYSVSGFPSIAIEGSSNLDEDTG